MVAVKGMPLGGLLVHRVVRLRDGGVLLRGDNSTTDNGEFTADEVLAVVLRVEREGKRVWFGAGRLGRAVAALVRWGCMRWANRVALLARRLVRRRSCEAARQA